MQIRPADNAVTLAELEKNFGVSCRSRLMLSRRSKDGKSKSTRPPHGFGGGPTAA
jgi:hypothetical protein